MPQNKIAEMLGQGTFGAMNYSERAILISNDVNDIDKQLITLHEVCHAISFVCGLSQTMPPETQEVMAESFANGFIEVMNQLAKVNKKKKKSKNESSREKNKMHKVSRL